MEDGFELLKYFDDNPSHSIGLIVLDLNMPCFNGTEILRKIKQQPAICNIPVVIFSTSVNEIEKTNCMQLGAHAYITKPIKWDDYLVTCTMFYNISIDR